MKSDNEKMLDSVFLFRAIAAVFVVTGVALMFFETGLDPDQRELIMKLTQREINNYSH